MKKRFTNQEITVVSNNYPTHPVYQIAKAICDVFYPQTKNFGLCEEEVFYETIRVIDDIKEQGTGYTSNLRQIFSDYQREFRSFDTSVPPEEWELAIHLIMCCVIIVLGMSYDSYHKLMGGKILNEIKKNSPERWKELIIQCGNKCQQFEYVTRNWINSYMAIENNEYISDEIDKMLNPANKKKGGKKKKEEKELKACSFHLGKGRIPQNIACMLSELTREGVEWIDTNTKTENFELLFSGTPQNLKIIWTGNTGKGALRDLFKRLIDEGGITTAPGFGYVQILENNFVDKDGHYLTGISSGRSSKKDKDIIEECVKVFMANLNSKLIEEYRQN